jgi:hypothetical protein
MNWHDLTTQGGDGMNVGDLSRAVWGKSSYSNGQGGDCVEVARNLPGVVAVRDSKDPDGPALAFAPTEWEAFAAGVKAGEFDLS